MCQLNYLSDTYYSQEDQKEVNCSWPFINFLFEDGKIMGDFKVHVKNLKYYANSSNHEMKTLNEFPGDMKSMFLNVEELEILHVDHIQTTSEQIWPESLSKLEIVNFMSPSLPRFENSNIKELHLNKFELLHDLSNVKSMTNLTEFTIYCKEHDNVSLTRDIFQDNPKLETFSITDCPGVNVIDPRAFYNVKGLTKVKIEETNLDLIHPNIFEHNKNLKEISWIKTLCNLPNATFANEKLESFTFQGKHNCPNFNIDANIFSSANYKSLLNLKINSVGLTSEQLTRDLKVEKFVNLKLLDLSDNQIIKIDGIKELSQRLPNLVVNLNSNPLECSCDIIGKILTTLISNLTVCKFDNFFILFQNSTKLITTKTSCSQILSSALPNSSLIVIKSTLFNPSS